MTLGDLASLGTLLATLIAAAGLFFAGRQVRLQASSSIVEVNQIIDDRWQDRLDGPIGKLQDAEVIASDSTSAAGDDLVRARTLTTVSQILESMGLQPETTLGEVSRAVPYALSLVTPWTAPSSKVGLREYEQDLVARCALSRSVFDALADSDDEAVIKFFESIQLIAEGYINVVNDIADLIDQRCVDPLTFFEKRHYLLIEEVYVLEPYIVWRTLRDDQRRWGMRVLALGDACRRFHTGSPVHSRNKVEFGLANLVAGHKLLLSGAEYSKSGRRQPDWLQKVALRRTVMKCFTDSYKIEQYGLLQKVAEQ